MRVERLAEGVEVHVGDALACLRAMPSASVHCCVTSPPYWGLRSYLPDGHEDKRLEIGLESTPEAYVAAMVEVFREVKRVLRDDGTLWLNIGDSYAGGKTGRADGDLMGSGGFGGGHIESKYAGSPHSQRAVPAGLKPKDLVGIPWLLAFALRADGWFLRSEIIWHKRAPMPESVTDRPTKSHEQVFLLAKSQRYFYDHVAAAEPAATGNPNDPSFRANGKGNTREKGIGITPGHAPHGGLDVRESLTRNMRTVWSLSPEAFRGVHFATMPTELARRCIVAGTSEYGCCRVCLSPWVRVTERTAMVLDRSERTHDKGRTRSSGTMIEPPTCKTIGWKPSCECDPVETVPCVVLDPFGGAATTGLVSYRLNRRAVLCELSETYVEIQKRRLGKESEKNGLFEQSA